MTAFNPIRQIPEIKGYKSGDVLVVFGEVFGRGYVNGLIDAAEALGMDVLYGTVGRRNSDGALRPLTEEEIAEKGHGPIINIPLEAGFDKEDTGDGKTLVNMLNATGKDWATAELDFEAIERTRLKGEARFRASVNEFLTELESRIPAGANVLIAHTMAGGIPASKRVLAVSNRIFKGVGDRHQSSAEFWDSPMGRACAISFEEVTARTFHHLIDLSSGLRGDVEANGGKLNYVAYGYHGTECLMVGEYRWQAYAPYLQGFAKMKLEAVAEQAHSAGVNAGVFNAPEILTNSSGIFVGVELPLYRLILALEKESESAPIAPQVRAACAAKLTDGEAGLTEVREILRRFHQAAESEFLMDFSAWPQHNTSAQMDIMIGCATALRGLHKDDTDLMTGYLSRLVFTACGHIMLGKSWDMDAPVYWIGHDAVAKALGVTGLPN